MTNFRIRSLLLTLVSTLVIASGVQAMDDEVGIECAECQFPSAISMPQCSGVYMGHNLVITAAHCVKNVLTWSKARAGESFQSNNWEYSSKISKCVKHPDYEGMGNGVDLAFCIVESDLGMPPIPPMIPSGCETNWLAKKTYFGQGATVTAVGKGCTEDHGGSGAQDCGDGVKRFSAHTLFKQVGPLLHVNRDAWGTDHSVLKSGDSGGPLFVVLPDKTWRLIGVLRSIVAGTSKAHFTAVPPYLHWIEDESEIDITPCHYFSNGTWYAHQGCAAYFPRSKYSQENWGSWTHACIDAPHANSPGHTDFITANPQFCASWPASPGSLANAKNEPLESVINSSFLAANQGTGDGYIISVDQMTESSSLHSNEFAPNVIDMTQPLPFLPTVDALIYPQNTSHVKIKSR